MSAPLTCPQGHPWQPGADDPSASRPPMTCPVCGTPFVRPLPGDPADILFGSRPSLPRLVPGDPEATIASDAGRRPAAEAVPHEISPALRSAVPGYEILEELGRGGMGVVYKARDLRLNRLVALKMVLSGVHVSPRELVRFRSEAAAVAGLQHPNIVQIYEVGEQEGRPYFALEYVEGGSLAQQLTGTPLPSRWSAQLIETLARTVDYAHRQKIIHRDLKPGNILLRRKSQIPNPKSQDSNARSPQGSGGAWDLDFGVWDLEPKVTDFGLAKQLSAAVPLTHSGTVLGTPSYMAPEQALGKNSTVGPAADIHALGAILYEMLTGRPPFRADTSLDTMLKVASEEPAPLSRWQPRIPRDLQTICLKCLAKEPWKRYPSGEALADDLHHWLEGEPIAARPVGSVERAWKWARRRPSLAALFVLVVCMVVLGFAGMGWMWRTEAEQVRDLAAAQEETKAALAAARVNLYCNRIALAEREWLANNVTRARHLLAECPPALRQWEWYYLYRLCHADLLTLRGPDSVVVSMAFNQKHELATLAEDQGVWVWDTDTGKALHTRRESNVRDRNAVLAYGPEGRLYIAGTTQAVRILDPARRDRLIKQSWPLDRVAVVSFSMDRRLVAAGLKDGTVKVWDLLAGKELFRGRIPGSAVTAIAFSPAGKLVAAGDTSGNVWIWEIGTNHTPKQAKQTGPIYALAFSPDGRRVAAAGAAPVVRLWEATTGNLLFTLRGHTHPAQALAFEPTTGRYLASGGRDQAVKVWDTTSGEEAFTLRGHISPVSCIAYSLDGKLLASAARDHTVKLWDATTGQEARSLRATYASHAVAFRPDGKHLATADGEVVIWDPSSSRSLLGFGGPLRFIEALAYSPDGRRLATAGRNGLKIWDPNTRRELRALGEPSEYVHSVAYNSDGSLLAATGPGGTVQLWDPHRGVLVRTLAGHGDTVTSVAFNPDGTRLASASRNREVKVWDTASGEEVFTLKGHTGPVDAVAFSPDGHLLASGGRSPAQGDPESLAEGEVRLWDAHTGEPRHTLWGHTAEVTSLAFSPDSCRLASGSEDHTVKVWDPVLGQEVLTLRGHTQPVLGVAFSPDGGTLVSTSADQTVRLWNATPLR